MAPKKTPRGNSRKKSKKARSSPKAAASRSALEKILRKAEDDVRYELKLYVTGTSPRSAQAIANVRSLCEEHLAGRYDLEVIDIYQQPGIAVREQIVAAPTLIKKVPEPSRRMIGDLSNRDKILVGLNIVLKAPKAAWVPL
jgi:circadian clock protein KaiB